jgi:hypothetical protein
MTPPRRQNTPSPLRFMSGGEEVYAKDKADALEAELMPLVGGPVVAEMFIPIRPTILSRRAADRTVSSW